jgi:hypothetical protein
MTECRSLIPGRGLCRDGFPTNGACHGWRCSCGKHWVADTQPPACMRDDLGPAWIDDAGRPKFSLT